MSIAWKYLTEKNIPNFFHYAHALAGYIVSNGKNSGNILFPFLSGCRAVQQGVRKEPPRRCIKKPSGAKWGVLIITRGGACKNRPWAGR